MACLQQLQHDTPVTPVTGYGPCACLKQCLAPESTGDQPNNKTLTTSGPSYRTTQQHYTNHLPLHMTPQTNKEKY